MVEAEAIGGDGATNPKLDRLRALMEQNGLHAFVCFHEDQHCSEYTAPSHERIAYISGFTGSNAVCVVTMNDARMWTDGRYYIAAGKQLEQGWQMMRWEPPMWHEHIKNTLSANQVVGLDYSQYPASRLKARAEFFEKAGLELRSVPNLIDQVWDTERPPLPVNPAKVLGIEFCGMSSLDKQAQIAEKLQSAQFEALLVTTLDDICWITNMRGTDIDYNPVFFSFALFWPKRGEEENRLELFIDESKVTEIGEYLCDQAIQIRPYESISEELTRLSSQEIKVGVHMDSCNAELHRLLGASAVDAKNTIQETKCKKNATEMEGMRNCNIRDCAAIMKYFAYLEEELKNENHTLNEYTGAMYLNELRTHGQYHQGPSFETISSIGANGAIIHYAPEADTGIRLNNNEIYLLDSGGQYLDGTTDITRTTHFGGATPPTAFQKQAYTRVLLGVLDLERIVWPKNSTIAGADMDILARMHLWQAGLDYMHGTGHGVGCYLNCHEGPNHISRGVTFKFEEGMCASDEPGYYKEGEFGIRIENVIMCVQHPELEDFYKWENLTVGPYSRNLIDLDLLSPRDICYIDSFHQKCLQKLTPLLQDDERALNYVKR